MLIGKIIFIFACLVCITNIIGKAYSRYESNADVIAEANVAFFLIDQGTYESSISLDGLTPSLTPFYYDFYVANYKDDKRTNTTLDYIITFETTTNLPLTYEIVRNETFDGNYTNIITNSSVRQDENDVFYKVFTNNNTYRFTHTSNQVDRYTLKVIFPESYKDYPDLYQGAVELFSIIINATQVA